MSPRKPLSLSDMRKLVTAVYGEVDTDDITLTESEDRPGKWVAMCLRGSEERLQLLGDTRDDALFQLEGALKGILEAKARSRA